MICCDEHAKHLRDASCPWCERDEAVRLLREAKAWIDHEPLVDEIIAYLDKVEK